MAPVSQKGGISQLAAVLSRPIEWAGRAASACGLLLVLVVGGNVLARYIFNTGTVAFQELEWHLVSPIALLGMSYALQKGDHVRVDFLYNMMGPKARHAVDLVTAILIAVFAVVIVILSLPYVQQSFSLSEGSPDPGGIPYRWVLKAFIPVGFSLLAIQSVAESLLCALRLAGAAPEPVTDDGPDAAHSVL